MSSAVWAMNCTTASDPTCARRQPSLELAVLCSQHVHILSKGSSAHHAAAASIPIACIHRHQGLHYNHMMDARLSRLL